MESTQLRFMLIQPFCPYIQAYVHMCTHSTLLEPIGVDNELDVIRSDLKEIKVARTATAHRQRWWTIEAAAVRQPKQSLV